MKKNFLTGLVLLLPFTLTVVIILWAINFLTNPFQGGVEAILRHYHILDAPFLFLSSDQVLYFSSKFIVLCLLFAVLLFIGFLGQLVLLKTFFRFGDYIITRIPFVNKLYTMIQEIVKTLFHTKGHAFSQVVIVPFPKSNTYSVALMTRVQKALLPCDIVSVFVPGSPNPTFGFMLTCKMEDIILLDMKVEEALKFIVSCGIMFPGFKITKPE